MPSIFETVDATVARVLELAASLRLNLALMRSPELQASMRERNFSVRTRTWFRNRAPDN
jgi:hypothetical protein